MILELIREHGPVNREDIDHLLFPKLPDFLTEKGKKDRIHHLLSGLAKNRIILNKGTRGRPQWVIAPIDVNRHTTYADEQ
jgi:ATP-dependent DNA helicase RecG